MRKTVLLLLGIVLMLFVSCSGAGTPPALSESDAALVSQIDPEKLIDDALNGKISGAVVEYEMVSGRAVKSEEAAASAVLRVTVTLDGCIVNGVTITRGSFLMDIPGTVTDGKFTAEGSCSVETAEKLAVESESGKAEMTITTDSAHVAVSASVSGSSVDKNSVTASFSAPKDFSVSVDWTEKAPSGEKPQLAGTLEEFVKYINTAEGGNVNENTAAGNLVAVIMAIAQESVDMSNPENLINKAIPLDGAELKSGGFYAAFWGTCTVKGTLGNSQPDSISVSGRLAVFDFVFDIEGAMNPSSGTGTASVNDKSYTFALSDIM